MHRVRILLLANTFCLQALISMLRPASSYRALDLGLSPVWLGTLSAAFAVVPLLVGWRIGRFADAYGSPPLLACGVTLCIASSLGLVYLTPEVGFLFVWSATLGIGHLMQGVGSQSLVAESWGSAVSDRGFAQYTLATSTGQLLGPLLVASLGGSDVNPSPHSMLTAVLSLCGLMLVTSLALCAAVGSPSRSAEPATTAWRLLRVPGLRNAILASTVVLSTADILSLYLPALGHTLGLPASTVGLLLALGASASIASRLGLIAVIGRIGRTRTLWISMALAAIGMIGVASGSASLIVLAVAVAITGLGLGVGQPLTMAGVALMAPPRSRSSALALRLMGNRLGQATLPGALGVLSATGGIASVFWATGLILMISATATARGSDA